MARHLVLILLGVLFLQGCASDEPPSPSSCPDYCRPNMSTHLGAYIYCKSTGCLDAHTDGVRREVDRLQDRREDQDSRIDALSGDIQQVERRIDRKREELRALEQRLRALRQLNRTTAGNVQISRELNQEINMQIRDLLELLQNPAVPPEGVRPIPPGPKGPPGVDDEPDDPDKTDVFGCIERERTDLIVLLRDLSREMIVPSDWQDVVLIGAGVIGQFIRVSRRARALLKMIEAMHTGETAYTALTRERVCPTK